MNEQIKKYWEDQGKQILCQMEPSPGITNVPIYYYHQGGTGPKIFVAAKWNAELTYWFYSEWHFEKDMLELIKK